MTGVAHSGFSSSESKPFIDKHKSLWAVVVGPLNTSPKGPWVNRINLAGSCLPSCQTKGHSVDLKPESVFLPLPPQVSQYIYLGFSFFTWRNGHMQSKPQYLRLQSSPQFSYHQRHYVKRAWVSALHVQEGISPPNACPTSVTQFACLCLEGSRPATQGCCFFPLTGAAYASLVTEKWLLIKKPSPLTLPFLCSFFWRKHAPDSCPSIWTYSNLNHLLCWGFKVTTSLEDWRPHMPRPQYACLAFWLHALTKPLTYGPWLLAAPHTHPRSWETIHS